jgi:hypothetical protein
LQSLIWYRNRLSLMSAGEVAWRLRRTIMDRLEPIRSLARPPDPHVASNSLAAWPAPDLSADELNSYLAAAGCVLGGRVNVFGDWILAESLSAGTGSKAGASGVLSGVPGKTIDYRDARVVGDARVVWEVNRGFDLLALAQAGALVENEAYSQRARQILEGWLHDNPYPKGLNWASALESGLRLINWYLAARFFGWHRTSGPVERAWLDSIYRHSQFIWSNQSRYSSANNHLIGEMAGLYVAAAAWPCWPASALWQRRSRAILEREISLQVHEDGVSREQSVGYQIFVLQLLIVAGLVGELHGDAYSCEYWSTVRRMIEFLRGIADASGSLPDFGDSDNGMALMLSPQARLRQFTDLIELEEAFSIRDWKPSTGLSAAAWLLAGFPIPRNWPREQVQTRKSFPKGGYFVLGDRYGSRKEVSAVFDAGPLGYLSIAAHGHADCLSFTLSLAGEQVLIDPGTYCYHRDLEWRNYFRSTAAHNTLRVDGRDQSEMGGPFMWLQRARPTVESWDLAGPRPHVRARHDGYARLPDPLVHTRELVIDLERSCIDVTDSLSCRGSHIVERFWHFAEECAVERCAAGVAIRLRGMNATLQCHDSTTVDILHGSYAPRAGWVSRRFGKVAPTTTVVFRGSVSGPTELRTSLRWQLDET